MVVESTLFFFNSNSFADIKHAITLSDLVLFGLKI